MGQEESPCALAETGSRASQAISFPDCILDLLSRSQSALRGPGLRLLAPAQPSVMRGFSKLPAEAPGPVKSSQKAATRTDLDRVCSSLGRAEHAPCGCCFEKGGLATQGRGGNRENSRCRPQK